MTYQIPNGFTMHHRTSPLTVPWEPIYIKHDANSVILGIEARQPHTNSRGLVHGGLIAALLDNVMGLAAGHALRAQGIDASGHITVSLAVEYLSMAKLGQWVTFEPSFVRPGKTLCFVEANAMADGEIIARGKSIFRTGKVSK
jgi:acyl-coenzyme A thioesterase PaaI-like protein